MCVIICRNKCVTYGLYAVNLRKSHGPGIFCSRPHRVGNNDKRYDDGDDDDNNKNEFCYIIIITIYFIIYLYLWTVSGFREINTYRKHMPTHIIQRFSMKMCVIWCILYRYIVCNVHTVQNTFTRIVYNYRLPTCRDAVRISQTSCTYTHTKTGLQ